MKNLFALILFTSFGLTACDGIFGSDDCNDCRDIACTEEFKMISVTVQDGNGDPVELADYKITYTKSGEEVDLNSGGDRLIGPSSYIIATDAMMKELKCDGTSITFSYSLDGKSYNDEKFLVGKDCCHIQWRDSKDQAIIIK